MQNPLINLDANATFGLLPEVRRALQDFPAEALNPSSVHQGGQCARAIIEDARDAISALLGGTPRARIVFTSGATEANNMALRGAARLRGKGSRLIISAFEHPSVREVAHQLSHEGYEVSEVGQQATFATVPPCGPAEVAKELSGSVALVSVMLANNETGYVFPVAEIAGEVRHRSPEALIHTDAVQACGKITVQWQNLGVDLLTLSAHKIGGFSGVGALVMRNDVALPAFIVGGPQEVRHRAGTENVWGIYAFGVAARAFMARRSELQRTMREHREYIERELCREIPDCVVHSGDVHGDAARALPNTLSVRVPGMPADDLVVALDLAGVCVSSGAACASGKPEPSHVLCAWGLREDEARQTIRISTNGMLSKQEVVRASEALVQTICHMRSAR